MNEMCWAAKNNGEWAYLQRRRNTLSDDQPALGSALRIVLHNQIARDPATIGILWRTDRVQWYSAVTGQRGMNNTVAEGDGTVGNGQRSE